MIGPNQETGTRPTTENMHKRARIANNRDRPSIMSLQSKIRQSGNNQMRPVQQLTANQATLITKKGFLRRE